MQPGLLQKGRVNPAVTFRKSPFSAHVLWLWSGKPCPAAVLPRPSEAGRFPSQDPPRQAVPVRGPDTVHTILLGPAVRSLSQTPRHLPGAAARRGLETVPRAAVTPRQSVSTREAAIREAVSLFLPVHTGPLGLLRPARRLLTRGVCTLTGPGPTLGLDGQDQDLHSLLW